MRLLNDAPLRKKLTWLAMTCSIVALTTTAVALGTYEWFFYRKVVLSQLVTLSALTAHNSSASLAFSDAEDALRVLTSLETEPAVRGAVLYDAAGNKFAEYAARPDHIPFPDHPPPDGRELKSGRFEIVVPVAESKRFGTLLVDADIRALHERFAVYGMVLLTTTTLSGLIAFLLAGRLKTRITEPVQALVNAASGVQTNDDYSVRVLKTENDELGKLTDAFNGMLNRIQDNQAELHRSEERLRLALDAAQIGTWDWDLERDVVRWDTRNNEIFDTRGGERVTADVFWGKIHPEDAPKVRAALDAAFQTGSFLTDFRLKDDGLPRFVVVRGIVLADSSGKPRRAVGVTIDVSERRRAELRVVESEQRFRIVAEKAPALIWSCDALLKRDYFNRTWLSFTGRGLDQELGDGWQASLHPEDLERWQATAATAARQSDPYSVEYRLRREDGAFRWVIETGSPRLSADGSFAGYLGTCIDITVRKENEAELESHVRLRTRQLELANQEMESFSYSVSHDLRSPVRVIQGFTDMAIEELQAAKVKTAVEPLRRIARAAARMDELITAFITLARISRAELRLQRVDLSGVAQEVISALRAIHPARGAEISIEPKLEVMADERLLRIALENLIGNAWKFTSGREIARIEVGRQNGLKERAFFVRDNGAGFNEAFAGKLFQVFQRLHSPTQFEGLGVGLNTVSRVIERHNGRVWAEGQEGKGAVFYFTLPEEGAKPS